MNDAPILGRLRQAVGILRPLPLLALVAWLVAPSGVRARLPPERRSEALITELARGHLDASDVRWVEAPRGLSSRVQRARALLLGRHAGEPRDVYLVVARLSPEGALLGVDDVFDVSKTDAADESGLVVDAHRAAWVVGDGERAYRVELADLDGERIPDDAEWTAAARGERVLMNYQRTGRFSGIGHRSFKLDPAAHRVELGLDEKSLTIVADGHRIVVPFDAGTRIEGERFVREEDRSIARPGNLVTWAVDRARDATFIGDERMQLTKAVAYAAFDAVDRAAYAVRPADSSGFNEELGQAFGAGRPAITDPQTGWPPPPLAPLVLPAESGEGTWRLLDDDPFTRVTPGAPSALVTTYLRADGARPDSRVYVVAWDPRQVELDMVPGTEEPQSATGETGSGMIPRRPEILTRLVAAFNGAFQSTHGDFGMMAAGDVLVPPKPYAATLARDADGSIGLGTWPYDLTVPPEFVAFRQNLTPIVADGKYNPYGRDWWGGVPHDWEDVTHTLRSGVCMTHDGFAAYFYATQIDPVHLGKAMLAARCDYGIHLDMNQGHTGLELYRVGTTAEMPPLSGKLDGHWQTEGDVPDMPGYRFRGRRLIRNLQLMHFPRYIRRSARDFFYLTLKPVLPGAPLDAFPGEGTDGTWTVVGLPQEGWPYALATTAVRPDRARPETKVYVLKVDPAVLELASPSSAAPTILTIVPRREAASDSTLWLSRRHAVVADERPDAEAVLVASGTSRADHVVAAAGVDADGMLVYAEVATAPNPTRDGALLNQVLDAARCASRLFFDAPLGIGLGGTRDLSDHPAKSSANALRLTRTVEPRLRRIFTETPILPPRDWMPAQRQTRFWPKPAVSGAPSASTGEATPPAEP